MDDVDADFGDMLLVGLAEAVQHTKLKVDWAKVDATTDEEIAAQIAADPDTAPAGALEDAIRNAQAMVRKYVPAGTPLVAELIADRRKAADRE